jgi:putative ABC transport system permease protein
MIFNAFSITLAQRIRENGLLRAIGATRRQILFSVLLEATVIGVLASIAGLAVGVGVSAGLKSLLGAMGFDIPAGGIVFATRSVIVAAVAGIGVCSWDCVGLVGFITIFASSARASINSIVGQAFTGDFIIDSGAGMNGGFDPSLAQRLGSLPEVSAVSGLRIGQASIGGSAHQVVAMDSTTGFQIINVKPLKGSESALGPDAIAVYKSVASQKHLKIGDPVSVVFKDTGAKTLRVALIYGANQPLGNYLLGISAYEGNFAIQLDSLVLIKKAPNATRAATLAAVESVASQYPGAKVLDESQYKAQIAKPINQLLGLVYVLLLLAVTIALLGIGNTLALSTLERT